MNTDVQNNHYVRQMQSRGALALSTSGSGVQMHGVDEIERMLPQVSKGTDLCRRRNVIQGSLAEEMCLV